MSAEPTPRPPAAAGPPEVELTPAAGHWVAVPLPPEDPPHSPFDDGAAAGPPARRRPAAGGRPWLVWVLAGAALNVAAVVGWVYLFGGFDAPDPAPGPPARKATRGKPPATGEARR